MFFPPSLVPIARLRDGVKLQILFPFALEAQHARHVSSTPALCLSAAPAPRSPVSLTTIAGELARSPRLDTGRSSPSVRSTIHFPEARNGRRLAQRDPLNTGEISRIRCRPLPSPNTRALGCLHGPPAVAAPPFIQPVHPKRLAGGAIHSQASRSCPRESRGCPRSSARHFPIESGLRPKFSRPRPRDSKVLDMLALIWSSAEYFVLPRRAVVAPFAFLRPAGCADSTTPSRLISIGNGTHDLPPGRFQIIRSWPAARICHHSGSDRPLLPTRRYAVLLL